MIRIGTVFGILLLVALTLDSSPARSGIPEQAPVAHWRHPVALAFTEPGRQLIAANRASGTLSVVDLKTGTVDEISVGQSLTDIVVGRDSSILVVDEQANKLFRLNRKDGLITVRDSIAVPAGPIQVRLGTGVAYVASRWARSVSAVALEPAGMKIAWTCALPFPPRPLFVSPDGAKVVVGDAFAGRVALLDASGKLESVRNFPGHNLSGFTLSPDGKRLHAAYSLMDASSETSMYNVHWGNVVVHRMRPFDLAKLLQPDAELLANSRAVVLDGLTSGATDPGPLAFDRTGRILLSVGGLDHVQIDAATEGQRQRLRVGKRPSAILVDAAANRAYIACTFDDTIAVLDLDNDKLLPAIRLGATPTLTPEVRGQRLFHDARLSHNGWLSCHTCHGDGHSNGKLADTFADGSHGTAKRTLSLLGVAETGPWNWRGHSARLEDVIDRSLRTTMYPDDVVREDIQALTAYLRTLRAPPVVPPVEPERVAAGKAVFGIQGCGRCHTPPLYTSSKVEDVGLPDEKGVKEFNPPSLRGVRLAGPYFHDGRARSLAEVFSVHKHQLKGRLSAEDLRDLLAFLESL